jgi:HSP20 family molecular chaperone IbpA
VNNTVKHKGKNKMTDIIMHSPIWELMDAFARPFDDKRNIMNYGLKSIIKRPHNLINVKDDEDNIIGQRLEMVTTPFKKEDVKITIKDNILTVQCGTENVKTTENEDIIYRGISAQSHTFSLSLAPTIDQSLITAENKDGILKINLPYIAKDTSQKTVEITVE